jgi:GTP:adenosylcobinamide-phosphate guanylyltransferase
VQAIILAGGLGSRLGPITAQRSKALVTIGQRPHLIHQLLALREAGVTETVVVVSSDTLRQTSDVVARAGLDAEFVVQSEPLGPANALLIGLAYLANPVNSLGVFMLMSDSFVDEPLALEGVLGATDWIGVAPAPKSRSFCYEQDGVYLDGPVDQGQHITVGVNYFASQSQAYSAALTVASTERARKFGEIPMSEFFNAYADLRGPLTHRVLETWLDVGDVDALASAHRTRFISRSHHKLMLDSSGVLVKYGEGEAFERQASWLLERQEFGSPAAANLTPRVYGVETSPGLSCYMMEYVDLPTLSELWLYWPGRPDVWQAILRNVVARLEDNLWTGGSEEEPTANVLWFIDKTRDRLAMRGLPEWHSVAEPLLDEAEELLRNTVQFGLVRGHGDLNFSNILYSLNTGMIKLIDPRGNHRVPFLYELAKLRYSYHAGFSAITHGLASMIGAKVTLLPQRTAEITALDDVLRQHADLDILAVCEGCLLVAGAPLHDGIEAEMLFWRGIELLREVLSA